MTSSNSYKNNFIPIFLIGVLFFIFGFVTWLNSSLIPFLKTACELNNFQAYLVTLAFYISYFVMALPSSWVLKKTGFKSGMSLGLFVMALGSFLFLPAAATRTYWMFITGLFMQGTGLSILQTASNPYVTKLGPIESAAKRISIMGICNKVAGFMGPLVLGAIILKNFEAIDLKIKATTVFADKETLLDQLAQRAILPYIIIGIVLLALSFFIRLSPLPEIEKEAEEDHADSGKKNIFQFPHLLLGALAIFFYVGAEVISIDTITLYGKSIGIVMDNARFFPLMPLTGMVIGYILGIILIPRIISQAKALQISAVLAILFSLAAILIPGLTSIAFIALLGLANAIMWPAIWPLAIDGLGKFTKTGSAMLIMGIAGGALLPLLYGRLADITSIGSRLSYLILLPCYLYILFFAVKGYKIRLSN
jgi:MFS transporter, FHS family, L-fucose permease